MLRSFFLRIVKKTCSGEKVVFWGNSRENTGLTKNKGAAPSIFTKNKGAAPSIFTKNKGAGAIPFYKLNYVYKLSVAGAIPF